MSPGDPIRRVSVVSTGHVQIRPDQDLVILPAHDPGAGDRLAQATGQPIGRRNADGHA
jgi:hypothetical protein